MHTFRRAVLTDLPFLLSIARTRYTDPSIDWPTAERYGHLVLSDPSPTPKVTCLCGQRSFLFLIIGDAFWAVKRRAVLSFFAALPGRDLESLALLRYAAAYARDRGCGTFEGGTDGAPYDSDVGILLRRIGAHAVPRYRVDL